jgi:hypothetical protein
LRCTTSTTVRASSSRVTGSSDFIIV